MKEQNESGDQRTEAFLSGYNLEIGNKSIPFTTIHIQLGEKQSIKLPGTLFN